ncbi:glycosyltransferase [Chromohalobacter sp. 48-RD10]|uniref:glycosyltransferase n=1 Tax=Chromohalobacter sp. 48-RD10 TaxID=2994063 RepID=UPI002468612E|nr:glycosyltransferase [Chromohalobacter sp. 48-RD10]
MIFLTVGGQLPFDRLIVDVERWHQEYGIEEEVVVQCGDSSLKECRFEMIDRLSVEKFEGYVKRSSFIISHVGMGNIITCLNNKKKGVFLPRLKNLGEHRNDHQLSTANMFRGKFSNLHFPSSREELLEDLSACYSSYAVRNVHGDIKANASIQCLSDFVSEKISCWISKK